MTRLAVDWRNSNGLAGSQWIDCSGGDEALVLLNRSPLRPAVGPHSTLVPWLLAQRSSDWFSIGFRLATDWSGLCQSAADCV